MIVLDTHIWIWWVNDSPQLTPTNKQWIQDYQAQGLGISVISCWEVAKLVEKNKLVLSIPVEEWLQTALAYPGVKLLNLTVPIVVQSTQLTGFHNDPADRLGARSLAPCVDAGSHRKLLLLLLRFMTVCY